MKKKSLVFEIIYCVMVPLFLVMSMLTEIGVVVIPDFFISSRDRNATFELMFQAQITMAVLPMAILALISGFINEKIYGIGIIKYFFEIKPVLLKIKRIMVMQLLFVLLGFGFYSFDLYNVLECLFFITVINAIILTEKVFRIFYFSNKLKDEIRKYLLNNLTLKNIKSLKADSEELLNHKEYGMLEDNIEILINGKKKDSEEQKNAIASIIRVLFQSGDEKAIICAIEQLSKVYEKMKDEDADYIYQFVVRDFLKSLKNIELDHLNEKDIEPINELRYNIILKTKKYNNIKNFSQNIYINAIVKNKFSDARSKEIYAGKIYDKLFSSRILKDFEIQDRLNFKCTTIKYLNKEIVEKQMFNTSDIRQQGTIKEMFIITIYLYYLSYGKVTVSQELLDYSKEIILLKKNIINGMLQNMEPNIFTIDFVNECYMYLQEWENKEINVWYTVMYEKIVNSFFVMYALTCAKYDPDFNILTNVVRNREFSLYEHYFGSEKSIDITKKEYTNFCELFGFKDNRCEIDLLKIYLSEKFKEYSIKNAMKESLTQSKTDKIQQDLYNYTEGFIDEVNNLFKEPIEKITIESIDVFDGNECVFVLKSDNIESIKEKIKAYIIIKVCRIIMNKLEIEKISRNVPIMSFIEKFEEQYSKLNYNLLLGYREWCKYDERDKFNAWKEGKKELNSEYINDVIFCVNPNEIYLNISKISLEIAEITKEEFDSYEIKKEGELYQYIITNNLQSKFTEDELYNYICNTEKKIRIKANFSYAFPNDIEYVGYGLEYVKK